MLGLSASRQPPQEQAGGAYVPPGFEADIRRVRQLEKQIQQDPGAIIPLIQAYKQIIQRLLPDKTPPLFYAATLNNLAIAYRHPSSGNRASNLILAIQCYQEALLFYTPEVDPLAYARTQMNLGNAYGDLPTNDRASNTLLAIQCYQEALRFCTPRSMPLGYATVQNNLGATYTEMPTENQTRRLTLAIQCYHEALRFRTPKTDPMKYAETQNNLGTAYCLLPTGSKTRNFKLAIQCYQEALRFWTPKTNPFAYAKTQHNMGNAYRDLPSDNRVANLERAIQCYHEALRFLTPQTDPLAHAGVQNNLGATYSFLASLSTDDQTSNLRQANQYYQQALRCLTPESEPFAYRGTMHNQADLHFAQGAWDTTLEIYRGAMDIGEQIYRAGLSTTSRRTEAFESAALYTKAAFAAIRCGERDEALLILERGKTRLLTEALRLRVRRPPHVPDEVWSRFEQKGSTVRALQAEKSLLPGEMRDPVQTYETYVHTVTAANAALNAATEEIRTYNPHFLEAFNLSAVEAQITDSQTALIAFCVTEQGSVGFVMSQHDQKKLQVVEVPKFTQIDLRRLLWDTDSQPSTGWIATYNNFLEHSSGANTKDWQETITRVLATVGENLLAPIFSTLPSGIKRIILLPSVELFLLPLHAAPLSANDPRLLCDLYEISYAPSLEVRAYGQVQASITQEVVPNLYAVINPAEATNLLFTPMEGVAIGNLFAQRVVDTGRVGTKERVLMGMRERAYIHFSCHGSYDWDDPPSSGLNLSSGERLTLEDLQQNDIDLSTTRLVTLSACETGLTDVSRRRAGEFVGIPAGFLLAGVPCVIGSLWAVPELSTAMLMERFYRNHLLEGMTFAAALREAQQWVRDLDAETVAVYAGQCYRQARKENKSQLKQYMEQYWLLAEQYPPRPPFAHPYYWAAFTVSGM